MRPERLIECSGIRNQIAFEYLAPEGGVTDLTRGASATIGEAGILQGAATGTNFSQSALWASLPADIETYPTEFIRTADGKPLELPNATAYPVSADGKYYNVNLLRRNYPPPTISRSYQGDGGAWFINQLPPEYAFDGDDNPWFYQSASGADANAGATLTIDMGQYFPIGAVRILYFYTGNTPTTQTLRLASLPTEGNWRTILDNTPGLDDHTYSFDAITARFLELKMKGPWGGVMEVMVYPSTQSGPPPDPTDGYDLSPLATVSANDQCDPPGPWYWPGAAIIANVEHQGTSMPYATQDCVGTYDLGAQYPVSRVYTNFYVGSNWQSGGRIDVAASPDAYNNVYDSGVGNTFSFRDSIGFTFPAQPVRYVRLTDYAIPGVGPAGGILESIQAFVTPPPRVAYYPLSDDRKYFKVNLARRATGEIQPTASVVYSNGAAAYDWIPSTQVPGNAIDGDDQSFNWSATPGNLAGATATVTVDLGQVQSLGAIREMYANAPPLSTSVRVAETLAGPWTTVRADAPVVVIPSIWPDFTTSFDAVPARYVELTMKGTTAVSAVNLIELLAYPSSTIDPAPSSGSHLDLTYLTGMSMSLNANMGQSGGPRIHAAVPDALGYYVKTAAQGGTGDAAATIDLGQKYSISEICFFFWFSNNWPSGGKVEVDDGTGNWFTVHDSGRGTAFGTVDGTQRVSFATRSARYVRLTGYFPPAATAGVLENIEVF